MQSNASLVASDTSLLLYLKFPAWSGFTCLLSAFCGCTSLWSTWQLPQETFSWAELGVAPALGAAFQNEYCANCSSQAAWRKSCFVSVLTVWLLIILALEVGVGVPTPGGHFLKPACFATGSRDSDEELPVLIYLIQK